jgi:hypothetical protein
MASPFGSGRHDHAALPPIVDVCDVEGVGEDGLYLAERISVEERCLADFDVERLRIPGRSRRSDDDE